MSDTDGDGVAAFRASLEEAGLGRHFDALKGGTPAVQLQHVLALKAAAARGPRALEAALADAGVAPAEDRARLAAVLVERLRALRGLKPDAGSPAETDAAAWQAAVQESGESAGRAEDVDDAAPAIDAAGETWPAGMRIVNGHLAHSIRQQGMIQEPNGYGYVHLAGEVERPRLLHGDSAAKKRLLATLKERAAALVAGHPGVVRRADVFDAFIIPPGSREGRRVIESGHHDVHIAEFDVVVLVECSDVAAARRIRDDALFAALKAPLDEAARFVHCIVARNAKRIAEVDHDRDGIFLFNYFYAADIEAKGSSGVDVLLGVWEYTAGWWTAKANLTNSTPLQPVDGERSCYSLINHCRWDRAIDVFPHLVFRPSLDAFVLKNFTANDIMAMPILYRLA